MRIAIVLFFSVLLHLTLLGVSGDLFPLSGDGSRAQVVGYTVRSADSFRPAGSENVQSKRQQVVVRPAPPRQKTQTTQALRKVDKMPSREHSVQSAVRKKRIEQKPKKVSSQLDTPLNKPEDVVDVPMQEVDYHAPGGEKTETQVLASVLESVADTSVAAEDVVTRVDKWEQGTEGSQLEKTDGESVANQSALPRYDINPKPKYPRVAKLRGWEGVVLFSVHVLQDGSVGKVSMLASSGYRSLDKSAKKALRRWRFKPALSKGIPVESHVEVPVRFSLRSL